MELNVWTNTTITASKWDDTTQKWTVTVERGKDGIKETREYITPIFEGTNDLYRRYSSCVPVTI